MKNAQQNNNYEEKETLEKIKESENKLGVDVDISKYIDELKIEQARKDINER